MSRGTRKLVGACAAAAMVAALALLALGAPVLAHEDHDDDEEHGPPTTTLPTTTSTTGLGSPDTTTTTEPPTTTTTIPTAVLGEAIENPFRAVPSSPGSPRIEVAPPRDEPAPPTTTVPPIVVESNTVTRPRCRFTRTRDRIVINGLVLEAPASVLGLEGTFARAYGMTCGLTGVVSVHGTETIDYTTNTFAQLSGRGTFVGALRGAGDVELTFLTRIPSSTSFAGTERAVESGRVTGMRGWRGRITLRYTVTDAGNSQGSYRAVFTRTPR